MSVWSVVSETISFTIVVGGIVISGFRLYIYYLLPRSVVLRLDTLMDETQASLQRAEAAGAIPPQSEYKVRLDW